MLCPYCREEVNDGAVKCKHCGSTLATSTPVGSAGADEFGSMFNRAFAQWKGNLGDLAILTLVFALVCWIPIVNIAFIAGYTRSLIKVARGEGRAAVADLFSAWDCFGNLLAFVVVSLVLAFLLHFVPFFGTLATICLGFFIFPGFFLIIDQRKGVAEAFNWCLATIRADFVNWLLAYLVGNLICSAGLLLFFIGVILSAPLGQLVVIQQYERVRPETGS